MVMLDGGPANNIGSVRGPLADDFKSSHNSNNNSGSIPSASVGGNEVVLLANLMDDGSVSDVPGVPVSEDTNLVTAHTNQVTPTSTSDTSINSEVLSSHVAELSSLIFSNPKLLTGSYRDNLRASKEKTKLLKKKLSSLKTATTEEISSILEGQTEAEIKKELTQIKSSALSKSRTSPNIKSSELNMSSASLESMIDMDIEESDLSRIEELLAIPGVSGYFDNEYKNRSENLNELRTGQKLLNTVITKRLILKKARQKILQIKVKSFRESRSLSMKEISFIDSIREKSSKVQSEIDELLKFREIAEADRFMILKGYKESYDKTGFIKTPSRQKIIDEIQDVILTGKNILLTGATGTGKTVLAVAALKEIGATMGIDDFVDVFSGTPDAKASDFIVKQRLKSGVNGGTDTYTVPGKVLNAFINEKIPVVDEIDLIPNDVLMRMKHLFTLRPGDPYLPQEDGDTSYILKTTNILATANIKSSKHTDREDLDPAIVRLFENIHVNYLPKEETFDLALVNLMHKEGFVYKASKQYLGKDDSVLASLIYCLKDVEENYMGVGEGQRISNKDKQYLKKAVLELGRFVSMFKGFLASPLEFRDYIKGEVINFITNMAYPKSDRLILVKIFSTKGFISKKDIPLLEGIMDDVSNKELDENILIEDCEFRADNIKFIDPYELVNLDPFNVRKFNSLKLKNSQPPIYSYLIELDQFLLNSDITGKEGLESVIQDLLTLLESNPELQDAKKLLLAGALYKLGIKEQIIKLKGVTGFETTVDKIYAIDAKRKGGLLNTDNTSNVANNGNATETSLVESNDENPLFSKLANLTQEQKLSLISTKELIEKSGFEIVKYMVQPTADGKIIGCAKLSDGRSVPFNNTYIKERTDGDKLILDVKDLNFDGEKLNYVALLDNGIWYKMEGDESPIRYEGDTGSIEDNSYWNYLCHLMDIKYLLKLNSIKLMPQSGFIGKFGKVMTVGGHEVLFIENSFFTEIEGVQINKVLDFVYDDTKKLFAGTFESTSGVTMHFIIENNGGVYEMTVRGSSGINNGTATGSVYNNKGWK